MIYKFENELLFFFENINEKTDATSHIERKPWTIDVDAYLAKLLRDYRIKVFYRKQEWNDVKSYSTKSYQIIEISVCAMRAPGALNTLGLRVIYCSSRFFVHFAAENVTIDAHDLQNTNESAEWTKERNNSTKLLTIAQIAIYFLFFLVHNNG